MLFCIALGMWRRVSLQELDISHIIIYNNFIEQVKVVEWLANRFTVQVYEVRSPASENMFFLFNSDIVNLFLNKNSGGGGEK